MKSECFSYPLSYLYLQPVTSFIVSCPVAQSLHAWVWRYLVSSGMCKHAADKTNRGTWKLGIFHADVQAWKTNMSAVPSCAHYFLSVSAKNMRECLAYVRRKRYHVFIRAVIFCAHIFFCVSDCCQINTCEGPSLQEPLESQRLPLERHLVRRA